MFVIRKVLKEISVGDLNPNETVQANLEAQLLSKLDHPAIVKFHASFVEQDNFCIITEYCEISFNLAGYFPIYVLTLLCLQESGQGRG
ncbi:Serine/threonine-protein kinase Nek11 [Saguinus oedipus]|uniref:non-specific serine/threonine protein kinase n=1 Tax=Saguinus oedipus TaxID=9490 RepID=A0ABQ9U0P6_SAGOE|nr:Serine/threonine-protein kinase Nek11 [Saguinus oedipus]